MEQLQASTQYEDWTGSAAADDADNSATRGLSAVLKARGLIPEGRFLVGFSLWLSEVDGSVSVTAYLAEGNSAEDVKARLPDSGPIPLTKIDVPLSLTEFLKCFKRLNIVMTRKGFGLNDRQIAEV